MREGLQNSKLVYQVLLIVGLLSTLMSHFSDGQDEEKNYGYFIGLSLTLSSLISLVITILAAKKKIVFIDFAFPAFVVTISLTIFMIPKTGILGEYTFELYYLQKITFEFTSMIGFLFCNCSWIISITFR